jgi:hypothetical protein
MRESGEGVQWVQRLHLLVGFIGSAGIATVVVVMVIKGLSHGVHGRFVIFNFTCGLKVCAGMQFWGDKRSIIARLNRILLRFNTEFIAVSLNDTPFFI